MEEDFYFVKKTIYSFSNLILFYVVQSVQPLTNPQQNGFCLLRGTGTEHHLNDRPGNEHGVHSELCNLSYNYHTAAMTPLALYSPLMHSLSSDIYRKV
jgi:hypothetical protein